MCFFPAYVGHINLLYFRHVCKVKLVLLVSRPELFFLKVFVDIFPTAKNTLSRSLKLKHNLAYRRRVRWQIAQHETIWIGLIMNEVKFKNCTISMYCTVLYCTQNENDVVCVELT